MRSEIVKVANTLKDNLITSISSALGVVVGLGWKDAITAWVKEELVIGNEWVSALMMTVFATFALMIISKVGKDKDDKKDRK